MRKVLLIISPVLFGLVFFSCSKSNGSEPEGSERKDTSDFTLSMANRIMLAQGERATIGMIISKQGSPGFVNVALSGSAVFSEEADPDKISYSLPGGNPRTQLTLKVGKNVSAGTYKLTITSEAGEVTHQSAFEVQVLEKKQEGKQGSYMQSGQATLLFSSGFEQGVSLSQPVSEGGSSQFKLFSQELQGSDVANFDWSDLDTMFGADRTYLFELVYLDDHPERPANYYWDYHFEQVTGWDGNPTRALYMGQPHEGGHDSYLYLVRGEDAQSTPMMETIYFRYRMKWPANLKQIMMDMASYRNGRAWYNPTFYKTPGQHPLEHRIEPGIRWVQGENDDKMYWRAAADHGETPFEQYWQVVNQDVPVPAGQWFTLEIYWYRSTGSDGRYYMAVDGNPVVNFYGRTKHELNVQRVGFFGLYGAEMPQQWVDDFQVWNDIPCAGLPCVVKSSE